MWILRAAPHRSMIAIAIVVAVGTVNGDTDKETPANQIARLIEQLGNDDFAIRETASKELEAIGEPALSALRRAAVSSPDAEIQWRAERVVQVLAARVGQKELAKWAGYWKDPNGVWIEFRACSVVVRHAELGPHCGKDTDPGSWQRCDDRRLARGRRSQPGPHVSGHFLSRWRHAAVLRHLRRSSPDRVQVRHELFFLHF
jgi:hypothetical protein